MGKGAFSKVKLGRWLESDLLVAIKVHKDLQKVDSDSLRKEIEVLVEYQHKNIIKLFSCHPKSMIEKKVDSLWKPH